MRSLAPLLPQRRTNAAAVGLLQAVAQDLLEAGELFGLGEILLLAQLED